MASVELTSYTAPLLSDLNHSDPPKQSICLKIWLVTGITLCLAVCKALYKLNILYSNASTFDSVFITCFFSFLASCIFTLCKKLEPIEIAKPLRCHLYLQALFSSVGIILIALAIQLTSFSAAVSYLLLIPVWRALFSSNSKPFLFLLSLLFLALVLNLVVINPSWFGLQSTFSLSNLLGVCAGYLSSFFLGLALFFHSAQLSPFIALIYSHLLTFLLVPYLYIIQNLVSTPSFPHFSWLYYLLSLLQGVSIFLAFLLFHYLSAPTSPQIFLLFLLEIPVAVLLEFLIFEGEWTSVVVAVGVSILVGAFRLKK